MACSQGTRDNAPMNIPNALTLFRMALIPVLVLVFWLPFSWSATASAAIFVLAAVTDWLDGYLQLQSTNRFSQECKAAQS